MSIFMASANRHRAWQTDKHTDRQRVCIRTVGHKLGQAVVGLVVFEFKLFVKSKDERN